MWADDAISLPSEGKLHVERAPPSDGDSGDITVYITKTGKKYHKANCRYLRKNKIPISLEQAKARGIFHVRSVSLRGRLRYM